MILIKKYVKQKTFHIMIKNNIKSMYIIIGLIFFTFILWNRLLRVRYPVNFSINNPSSLLSVIFLITSILLIIYLMLITLKTLKVLPAKKDLSTTNEEIKIKIYAFVSSIIRETFKKVFYNIPKIFSLGQKLYVFGKYLHSKSEVNKNFTFMLITSFVILPKIIVSVLFFYDVILTNQLDLSLKALILLIFPLMFNVLIYTLKDFSYTNRKKIETEFLNIQKNSQGDAIIKSKIKFKDENEFKDYADLWNTFGAILIFSGLTQDLSNKIMPYISLFTYGLYLPCSIFILINNLSNLPNESLLVLAFYTVIEEPFSGLFLT